jgi:hypothetical protein
VNTSVRIAGVVMAAVLTGGLGACGGSSGGPDVAGCKAAMKKDFATALSNPSAPPATRPPACKGVDNKTLERLAAELMQGK